MGAAAFFADGDEKSVDASAVAIYLRS